MAFPVSEPHSDRRGKIVTVRIGFWHKMSEEKPSKEGRYIVLPESIDPNVPFCTVALA